MKSNNKNKKSKSNKKLVIILASVIILILLVLLVLYKVFAGSKGGNLLGDRCSEKDKYEITSSQTSEIAEIYSSIEEVSDVEVFTNACTVKIIVNLTSDVEIETLQEKSTEILTVLDEEQKTYFDYALYITSDDKESEIFPINVTKNKQRDDFVWTGVIDAYEEDEKE